MKIKILAILSAFASLFLTLGVSGCGSSPSAPLTAAQFGAKYKFSPTDISGWQLDPTNSNAFQVLDESTSDNLTTLIDGGAGLYTDRGCTMTVYQSLVGPNGETADPVYAMDFGTAAHATAMFNYQAGNLTSTPVSVPGFGSSVAIGYSALASTTVYAHFSAMYFELTLSGFADQTSPYQTAAQFLTVFQTKTN